MRFKIFFQMQNDQWTVNQPEVQVGNIFVLQKMRPMS